MKRIIVACVSFLLATVACTRAPTITTSYSPTPTQSLSEISVSPAPGNFLLSFDNVSSAVLLEDIALSTDYAKDDIFTPWYKVEAGDPILLVSGRVRNMHRTNQYVMLQGKGYDESRKQVAWTIERFIYGVAVDLKYDEVGTFSFRMNLTQNVKLIEVYGATMAVAPP